MRNDLDPVETSEWREAFDSVLEFDGADRAAFLLEELIDEARRNGRAGAVLGEHAVSEHDPAARSSRRTRVTGRSSTGSGR